MGWQYTPVTPLLLVSIALTLALAAFLLVAVDREGRRLVVFALVGMEVGSAYWAATTLLKLSRTELSVMILAEQLQYLGGTIIVVSWFVFTFAYTDHEEWLTPRTVGAVAALPVLAALLSLTNGSHELLWTAPRRITVDSFASLAVTRQPAFYAFAVVNYAIILTGIYVLARLIVGSQRVYRGQAAALIGAAAIPTAGNVVVVLELGPWPGVDLSPIAFAVSGALLVFAITRYDLLDLEPVARRRVVQRMRDGFVVVDETDRVVDLNPAASDLLDVDSESAVGRELSSFAPELASVAADDGTDEQTTFHLPDDDRFVQARSAPLDPAAEGGGRLVLLQDVTGRRRMERRHQRLVEKATDVIFVLDTDGTITYVSPAVENVLGAKPDAVIGEDALQFVHPDDRGRIVDLFERGIEDPGATYRFEFRVRNRDGEWTPFEGIGRNLLDDPFVEGVVVNARDITERKERERELERQNERLDEFASVVSHDLRNPLEVARGNLELARTGDDADREAALDQVAEAHDRMENIIDDVLTLAREGQAVTGTEPVEIATAARSAWDAVETDDATLDVADPPTVAADPDRLRRLFENLFRNAVEHGSTGSQNAGRSGDAVEHGSTGNRMESDDAGVTVTVGRIEPLHTGTRVETDGPRGFFVEDDGPGLPETDTAALFEFGYTTGDDGTGIGLAIVSDIAEAHGWTVTAGEGKAGGARFEFTGVDRP